MVSINTRPLGFPSASESVGLWKRIHPRVAAILSLIAYAAITLTILGSDLPRLASELLADTGDGLDNYWNIWWVQEALLVERTNPFFTRLLWHDHGTPLWFHALTPINGLISLTLKPFFDPILTYNVIVLQTFILAGWHFYLLLRIWVRSRWIAFLGGLLFTFSPFHFSHSIGHLNFISYQFVPLFLYAWIRGLDTGRRRWQFLSAICLLLVTWSDLFFLVCCVPLALATFVQRVLQSRGKSEMRAASGRFVLGFLAWSMVTVAPFLAPAVWEVIS